MPHTLVVLDDDSLLGRTLSANLEDAGYHPEAFTDGRAALNYFAAGGQASALLLDWKMRDMDGPEFLAELRAQGCEVPVLVLTGYLKPGIKEEAMALGATALMDKSKSFSAILEQVQRVVAQVRPLTGAAALLTEEHIPKHRST